MNQQVHHDVQAILPLEAPTQRQELHLTNTGKADQFILRYLLEYQSCI